MFLMMSVILVATLILLGVLCAISKPQAEVGHDDRSIHLGLRTACALQEICRTVLNPQSLSFVAANAPRYVLNSFEVEQQRLAHFSLGVASNVLVERLTRNKSGPLHGRLSRSLQSPVVTTKSVFLLASCSLSRITLGAPHSLRALTPQRLQVRVSAKLLNDVGNLLTHSLLEDGAVAHELKGTPIRCRTHTDVENEESVHRRAAEEVRSALFRSLPNDFARLIFLATLRDNNSGHYYHPEAARRLSPQAADAAMLTCHKETYERVVALPLEDVTDQVDTYMDTVRVPKERLIETWKKLRAYRATVPMNADPISVEIFFMKVDVAVAILEARLPFRNQ